MPDLEKEQRAYFKWLHTTASAMLEKAWESELPMFSSQIKKCKAAAKKEAKKNKEIDVNAYAKMKFLEEATLPVKDQVDEDGDVQATHNKMTRRYQYTSRETGEVVINRPTF